MTMTQAPQKGIGARALQVGRIGKIHSENLVTRIVGTELAIMGDVFPDELNAVASRLGVSKKASDYRDIINLPGVETVVICCANKHPLPNNAGFSRYGQAHSVKSQLSYRLTK